MVLGFLILVSRLIHFMFIFGSSSLEVLASKENTIIASILRRYLKSKSGTANNSFLHLVNEKRRGNEGIAGAQPSIFKIDF